MLSLLIPTAATALVLGHDVVKDARWVRERIGYVNLRYRARRHASLDLV